MGLRVNTNITSLNAQRNLANSTQQLNKTLEKLSTGLRINRAADDAAGMAISQGLSSQVRGLEQASRNANDAISIVQTAEGAIAEQVNISQRLRELAVQASSGTLSSTDRNAIQEEVDQLISEFDRIATQTSFNGVSLLNGFFGTKGIQVGSNAAETVSINLASTRSSAVGAVAQKTGSQRRMDGVDLVSQGLTAISSTGYILINSVTISSVSADGVSSTNQSASAIAIAEAINAVSGSTGVTAKAQATVITAADNFSSGGSLTTGEFKINDVSITGSFTSAATAVDVINNFTNQTGVEASVQGSKIVLTASDGRNIHLDANSVAATQSTMGMVSGAQADVLVGASVKLTADDNFTVSGSSSTYVSAGMFGITSGTQSVSATTTAISNVNLTTQADATIAIDIIDYAISQLNSKRSNIGALQNRFESTIRNIAVTTENLSAANSRIKDADIAAETSNLTKAQILQQAGISVLSQANVSNQSALALLQ